MLEIPAIWINDKQESRAAERKPRDAEDILFGLMFANQTNLTKQNRLCLKQIWMQIYINYVTRHMLYPCFSPNFMVFLE